MPNKPRYITRWFTEIAHNFVVTSPYGNRPTLGDFHRGIDFGGKGVRGTPVKCPRAGTVTNAGFDTKGYGNYVGVRLPDNHTMVFAHLDRRDVKKGDKIAQGHIIGTLGNTGNTTGPHLHFQINSPGTGVRGNGACGDPDDYIFEKGGSGMAKQHKIAKGDTYGKIGQQYGIDYKLLMKWNPWPATELPIGEMMLLVDPATLKPEPEPKPEVDLKPVLDAIAKLGSDIKALRGDLKKGLTAASKEL